MNTIAKKVRTTYEVTKSEFIASLCPVSSVEEAKTFFEDIRHEFSDATHHITAYTIGKSGEAGHYSDDGEPSGTAGLPVLDVFRKNDITNFACVVTRYFGGIKLGAGGLVRAYSNATIEALKKASHITLVHGKLITCSFSYSLEKQMEHLLSNTQIVEKKYLEKIIYKIKITNEEFEKISNQISCFKVEEEILIAK